MYIPQDEKMKAQAKALRKHMTPQENLLWNTCLKHASVQVYRQYVIENYIVDFFCRKARLVIEVDGAGHYSLDGMQYDKARTARLAKYGILVLRFSNLEVEHNLKNVCQYIMNVIEERVKSREVGKSDIVY